MNSILGNEYFALLTVGGSAFLLATSGPTDSSTGCTEKALANAKKCFAILNRCLWRLIATRSPG